MIVLMRESRLLPGFLSARGFGRGRFFLAYGTLEARASCLEAVRHGFLGPQAIFRLPGS